VSSSMTDEAQAKDAWAVLKGWLASTPDGQLVLEEYKKNPGKRAGALESWLQNHSDQAPAQLATYVQGGQVDKLVNIAHAGVVTFDASGWSLFLQARGPARWLIVLGTGLALVGFACFGYPIVKAISTFNSGLAAAERRCRQLYDDQFELTQCLHDANVRFGGAHFEAIPWIPLAAVLMFTGIVLSFLGTILIRPRG
jgi:hypothetical protein